MRFLFGLVFSLFCFGLSPTFADAERHALIIGNANYAELEDLENTHADAKAYQKALSELGFKTTLHLDLDLDTTLDALDELLGRVEPGDEVAFVYSGHGWSDGRSNFLLPIDAPKQGSDRQLRRSSLSLSNGQNGLLDELETSGVGLTVAIVDACRNNPFTPRQGKKSAGLSRGLAPITAPQGTFVIFSAGSGQEALDRLPEDPPEQNLSVFTRTFVPLLKSGLYLEDAIAVAQEKTYEIALTYNGHQQQPSYYDETRGKTCLGLKCNASGTSPHGSTQATDQIAFIEALEDGTSQALINFINSHPQSTLKARAEEHLEKLASVTKDIVAAEEVSLPSSEHQHAPPPTSEWEQCAWFKGDQFCASSVLTPGLYGNYDPSNLFDGDPNTVWVEGARGHGLGEWIALKFQKEKNIKNLRIRTGDQTAFSSIPDRSRIKKLEVHLSTGDFINVLLQDNVNEQVISLADYPPVMWVQLKVKSVYEGLRYRETAVGELGLEIH